MGGRRCRLAGLTLVALLQAAPGVAQSGGGAGEAAAPSLAEVRTFDVTVAGTTAFLGQTLGLEIRDVADPEHTVQILRVPLPATVHDVVLADDVAYLAAGSHGLVFLPLEDPETALGALRRYYDDHSVSRVVVHGQFAYLAEGRDGLTVVDLREPDRPRRAASIITPGKLTALASAGELLATAEGQAGTRLFDLHRPANPEELATLRDSKGARDVAILGERVLVAAGRRGVLVFDIAVPHSPRLVAEIAPLRSANWVTAGEGLALVSNGESGFQVLDPAREPGAMELAAMEIPGRYPVGRAAIAGHTAYIAIDRWGLAIVDLGRPAEPVVLTPRPRKMRISFP